jgi:hypothetical protein
MNSVVIQLHKHGRRFLIRTRSSNPTWTAPQLLGDDARPAAPRWQSLAAAVTSADRDRVRATAIDSCHCTSHDKSIGPVPFDLDGWLGATGWPATYVWKLVPGTNPEPYDQIMV